MLKLPGFSLKVIKYVGDKTHCLRYVFKNRTTGDMYFNVNFTLLWGEELQRALEKDGSNPDQERTASSSIGGSVESADGGQAQKSSQQHQPSQLPSDRNEKPTPNTEAISSSTAPTVMQLHPGDHQASAQCTFDNSIKNDQILSGSTNMQLHPGDHRAAAAVMATSTDPAVDEIDKLLQQTSTSQQRGGRFLDDLD